MESCNSARTLIILTTPLISSKKYLWASACGIPTSGSKANNWLGKKTTEGKLITTTQA